MTTPAAESYNRLREAPQTPYTAATHTDLGLRELTHADRCDQCGAAAWVRTESYQTTHQLLWCAHHFNEHQRNGHFTALTHNILDERPHLKAAVKSQANRKEAH